MCQVLSYGLELSSNSWARTRQNLLNVSFANLDEISLFVTSQPPLVSLPHSSSPTHTQKVGHAIPLGRPSAPAPSIQYHASNLDW